MIPLGGAPTRTGSAALHYARLGWHVLPVHGIAQGACTCRHAACTSPGKHPLTANGVKDATTDAAQIEEWWTKWPDANVAIATGPSLLLVLDVDPKNGGEAGLRELLKQQGEGILATLRVKTGSGGLHAYYKRSLPLRNSAGTLGQGLDTRGEGGFVVAPPSKHYSGNEYTWAQGQFPGETALLEVPTGLADRLLAPHVGPTPTSGGVIIEGGRNQALTRMAGAQQRQGMPREAILKALLETNRLSCRPPLPEREVYNIVDSITRYKPTHTAGDALIQAGKHDVGNGQRLVSLYGSYFRHVHEWGYLVWDGKRWSQDKSGAMDRFAKQTMQALLQAAATIQDEKAQKDLAHHATSSQSAGRIKASLEMARSEPGVNLFVEDFDTNPDKLNVANGILDLKTGDLTPHDPDAYMTRLADVEYDRNATCPRWLQFMEEITLGNQALAEYLQRGAGYSLTGHTTEQVLFFCFGDGANGKSTFLETIRSILGDYAMNLGFEAFLASKNNNPEQHLARLPGRRMVTAIEAGEGRSFNEEMVKMATGEDAITARELYKAPFDFTMRAKIWLGANDKPTIKGANTGIWRRFHVIPWQAHYPPGHPKRDPALKEKLLAELPGILAWLVRGSIKWYTDGLQVPPQVSEALEEYKAENDLVGRFVDEFCTVGSGLDCKAGQLLEAYNDWAKRSNERELNSNLLGRRLAKYRAGLLKRDKDAQGHVVWRGLCVGVGVPTGPLYQGDRMQILLRIVRDRSKENAYGYVMEDDVLKEAGVNGINSEEALRALKQLQRDSTIYCRGGSGTYAPLNN